ncbi:MAG: hypothetical protein Q4F57_01130 [Weeksellaceae bacterium]|nr:hypothetical protein [Weeksellaceae bacterium]
MISKAQGSKIFIIGKCEDDKSSVYVTELWNSKEYHDNSLKFPGVKELIMKAMTILDGQPEKGKEIKVLSRN